MGNEDKRMSEPKPVDEQKPVDDPGEIAKMNQRQMKLGMLAQEIATAALLELKQKLQQGQPLNLSGDEAKELLNVGLRMERAARGLREPEEPDDGEASIPKATKPN
jgi:hypothetical protein